MKIFQWMTSVLLLATAGCASFTYDGKNFEPNLNRVIVFNVTQAPAPSMWASIGKAELSENARLSSDPRLIDSMRLEAGECGADAIHILSIKVMDGDRELAEGDVVPWSAKRILTAELFRHIPIMDAAAPEKAAPAEAAAPAETPAAPAAPEPAAPAAQ